VRPYLKNETKAKRAEGEREKERTEELACGKIPLL
jgi:hypothetical protein